MVNFELFVARHGEIAAQAVVENLERFEGVRHDYDNTLPLEARWERLMPVPARMAA